MPSVAIKSFGCRANQAESFAWAAEFEAEGVVIVEDPAEADLVVVNSCTLTSRADRDVYKFIRKVRLENPGAKIIVTGCLAERAAGDLEAADGVSLVLGNRDKDSLVDKAEALTGIGKAAAESGSRASSASHAAAGRPGAGDEETDGDAPHPFRSRAILKVQDGCGHRCTYCVIPSVRGRSRSVPLDKVLFCLKDFAGRGFREAVLAGIHLSSYGEDLEPKLGLTDLIRAVEGVDGLGWIRLTSLDPRRMDEEFVSAVAGNPKVAQHFHLSLQHASSDVLRRMGRTGNAEIYGEIMGRLRAASPRAGIGADIIVGFPGETDEDFELLRDFLERSPLTYFHVFSFSPRKGTVAAGWPPVPDRITTERSKVLRAVSAAKNLEFRRSFIGGSVPGVVIKATEGTFGGAEVLTHNYIRVTAVGPAFRTRDMVRVTITGAGPRRTEGRAE